MEVKYTADIDTPDVYQGYFMNNESHVPFAPGNRDYDEIQIWISEGNTPDDPYTPEELAAWADLETLNKYNSMVAEGEELNQSNQTRVNFDGPVLITEIPENEAWMQDLYLTQELGKPPGSQRQLLNIYGQDEDDWVAERGGAEGAWNWIITLLIPDTTLLSVGVFDNDGVWMYNLYFGLCWRGMCVVTQDTTTKEPLYFKFNMDQAVTGLIETEADENFAGVVWSDPEYD